MATISDLPIPDFTQMSDDELLELVKNTRARRRNPDPEVKEASVKKATTKAKKGKAVALQDVSKMLKGLTKEQAAELLAQLRGTQNG